MSTMPLSMRVLAVLAAVAIGIALLVTVMLRQEPEVASDLPAGSAAVDGPPTNPAMSTKSLLETETIRTAVNPGGKEPHTFKEEYPKVPDMSMPLDEVGQDWGLAGRGTDDQGQIEANRAAAVANAEQTEPGQYRPIGEGAIAAGNSGPDAFDTGDPGLPPEFGVPQFDAPHAMPDGSQVDLQAPEAGDPGVLYPAPEASDPGIAYPAPEDSDPGIVYSAPEDSDPEPSFPAAETP